MDGRKAREKYILELKYLAVSWLIHIRELGQMDGMGKEARIAPEMITDD
jgi:hypothetical protein